MMDAQLLKVCEADNIAVNKGSDKTVLQWDYLSSKDQGLAPI